MEPPAGVVRRNPFIRVDPEERKALVLLRGPEDAVQVLLSVVWVSDELKRDFPFAAARDREVNGVQRRSRHKQDLAPVVSFPAALHSAQGLDSYRRTTQDIDRLRDLDGA